MQPNRQYAWWDEDEDSAGPTLVALCDRLRENDSLRLEKLRLWDEIYRGTGMLDSARYALDAWTGAGLDSGRLNFVPNAVDFLHSKVTAQVPGVRAVGSGAKWDGLRIRRLTHFVEGALKAVDSETEVPRAVLAGLRAGTSGVKAAVVDGRLHIETVPASEIFLDPDDARHGRPRCMYQVRPVSKQALVSSWAYDSDGNLDADVESAILSANPANDEHGQVGDGRWSWSADNNDSTDVYEAWRLPHGDEPGRHVICGNGFVLIDEEWDCPRFPIALFICRDPEPGHGVWGTGIVERLAPMQDKIDELLEQIDGSIRHARLKVFVSDSSDIVDEHLVSNQIGDIIQMSAPGQAPQFVVPDTVGRQVFQHLQWLVDQLYSTIGMNESAAGGMKPAGLNSGKALQYFHDFQTQRHVDLAKRASRLTVDIVERLIDAARMAFGDAEGDETLTVRYGRGSSIRQVRWDQVDMDRDEYSIELLPVSPIPSTFSGQVQAVEDSIARGLPPPPYAEQLMADPDLWKVARISMAEADYVDAAIERLLDPEAEMPLVLDAQNLELTFDICRVELLNIVREGADPEVVWRFQDYMAEVADAMQPPEPNPAMAPQMPMDPMAGPPQMPPMGGVPPVI